MRTNTRLLALVSLVPLVALAQPTAPTADAQPVAESAPSSTEPSAPHSEVSASVADRKTFTPAFTLWTSPITFLMAGAVLEGELRLGRYATAYATGEFYGLWMGWGFQAGTRLYPGGVPMRGFFVDLHARANNLWSINLIGGGIEIGAVHVLNNSPWSVLWSVGTDIGAGNWSGLNTGVRGFEAFAASAPPLAFTAQPKLRLMLGYQF